MIECVRIPNLKRRQDRRYMALGALSAMGVRADIRFFDAHDGKLYGDDVARFISDVKADGFNFLDGYDEDEPMNIPARCCTWTFSCVFREIAADNRVTLFLIDDFMLTMRWPRLQGIVELLINSHDMKCLALGTREICDKENNGQREPRLLRADSIISRGILGEGEYGLVLTPDGAQTLLDAMASIPYPGSYERLMALLPDMPGFFSLVEDAVSYHYGVYRRAEDIDWRKSC